MEVDCCCCCCCGGGGGGGQVVRIRKVLWYLLSEVFALL